MYYPKTEDSSGCEVISNQSFYHLFHPEFMQHFFKIWHSKPNWYLF